MSKKKIGLAPGSVVYTGNKTDKKINIHVSRYNSEILDVKTFANSKPANSISELQEDVLTWYDIRGVHDTSLVEFFGKEFNIHSLVLEDIVNIFQRAKYEEFEDGIFITLKALAFDQTNYKISTEQVSIYFRNDQLISFQEHETDLFLSIRNRIENKNSKLRTKGTDYLAYALVDCLVDNYFLVLENMGEVIQLLEDDLIAKEDIDQKSTIHRLKKEFLMIRKSITPLRELISRFAKSDSLLINEKTEVYIRDLQDHTIQLLDIVETYRDVLNGLYDLLMTNVSFKMNKVMQVLTIISTIFIPLTFLAGIYGMNFDSIPELHWKYGYHIFWVVILIISAALVSFFRKKKWF